MLIAWWTVCALLCLLAIGYTLWPLLGRSSSGAKTVSSFQDYQRLVQERERLMLNLLDLETDFSIGKISSTDFEPLKWELLADIGSIDAKIRHFETEDLRLSKILQDLKDVKL